MQKPTQISTTNTNTSQFTTHLHYNIMQYTGNKRDGSMYEGTPKYMARTCNC